ncbi:hypothetical protein J6590_016012 [Homalodisca vitripennis]|nr:hypothetical protein J6590_016012 [Homalodisca vitripennis]
MDLLSSCDDPFYPSEVWVSGTINHQFHYPDTIVRFIGQSARVNTIKGCTAVGVRGTKPSTSIEIDFDRLPSDNAGWISGQHGDVISKNTNRDRIIYTETVDIFLPLHLAILHVFKSKCETIRGSDIHPYATKGRDDFRSVRHRTAGVRFVNKLPSSSKIDSMLRSFKTLHGTQLGDLRVGLLTGEKGGAIRMTGRE